MGHLVKLLACAAIIPLAACAAGSSGESVSDARISAILAQCAATDQVLIATVQGNSPTEAVNQARSNSRACWQRYAYLEKVQQYQQIDQDRQALAFKRMGQSLTNAGQSLQDADSAYRSAESAVAPSAALPHVGMIGPLYPPPPPPQQRCVGQIPVRGIGTNPCPSQ